MLFFFFFNDTATTEIYTLSLHDALPISGRNGPRSASSSAWASVRRRASFTSRRARASSDSSTWSSSRCRSEEHTSELQSLAYLVCRLLLEKKKNVELL